MEKEKRLYSKKKLRAEKVLLSSTASRDSVGDVKVEISVIGLEEKSSNGSVYIPFDFDVKFAFSLSPPSIKFERNEETATYKLKSSEDVDKWRLVLKNLLNQRGFH